MIGMESYEAAYTEGKAMTMEQATACSLGIEIA
jgi:hypothetical protein